MNTAAEPSWPLALRAASNWALASFSMPKRAYRIPSLFIRRVFFAFSFSLSCFCSSVTRGWKSLSMNLFISELYSRKMASPREGAPSPRRLAGLMAG